MIIKINDNKNNSIVVEVIRTVFFYQDILHKNKTHKYLNGL